MSDTAILIATTAEDLKGSGQLPGDLKRLRSCASDLNRIVHFELIIDEPGPDAVQVVRRGGGNVTVLAEAPHRETAVATALLARALELLTLYPRIARMVLAGPRAERLASAAGWLRKSGCEVVLCTPDRRRADGLSAFVDQTQTWGSPTGGEERGERGGDRGERTERGERAAQDPYQVLVEEVSRSRKQGRTVMLTSLKQRMRRKMRRFDETKLKDAQGRPMRKFKDFVEDAVGRGLVQLVDLGNSSQVLMPDEVFDPATAEEAPRSERPARRQDDPLLDSVDLLDPDLELEDEDDTGEDFEDEEDEDGVELDDTDGDSDADEGEENGGVDDSEPGPLNEEDFDFDNLDEDIEPPPLAFVELLSTLLKDGPLPLQPLLLALNEKRKAGELELTAGAIQEFVQAAISNELLETAGESKPALYQLADDWRDIIDYL